MHITIKIKAKKTTRNVSRQNDTSVDERCLSSYVCHDDMAIARISHDQQRSTLKGAMRVTFLTRNIYVHENHDSVLLYLLFPVRKS